IAVHNDLHAVLDVVHAITGHGKSSAEFVTIWGPPKAARMMGSLAIPAGPDPIMIPAKRLPAQPARWQELWRDAISDPRELLDLLGLSHRASELLPDGDAGFAMRVPRGFVARMRRGDASDPLLLQVLPQAAELGDVPGFTRDAVGDLAARAGRGVLH